ncbi:MAG TPA: FAD-dependent monooxygenase [Myxococcota bacterium]|nr:FAD-dependent monooxygenase [Myxococcota bacterium]
MPIRTALVVGGGIAGLSAAISLGKRGVACSVIDLYGHTEGASIGITSRAVHALEELGVLDECRANGIALEGGGSIFDRMFDSAGNLLPAPPRPPMNVDTRLPAAVTIFRPELARILRAAAQAAGASYRTGVSVESLKNLADGVEVQLSDGSTGSYDLVIGADGTRSAIRGMIHGPEVRERYTGAMSFRWLLAGGPPIQPGFYAHADQTLVVIGRLRGEITYLATGGDMENRRVEPPEARRFVADILAKYAAPYLVSLRERLDDRQEIIVRPFEWILVPAPWHRGRVTLLGDAAHSSTAHLSAGGGMALEDSVVLGQELERAATVEAGLDAFMARRMPRATLVVETGVKLIELQQAKAPLAVSGMTRGRALMALAQPY